MKNIKSTLLVTVLALSGYAQAQNKENVTLEKRLDVVIETAIAEHRIVGTVVLVAKNGKLVYHMAAGYADREKQVPIQEHTIFRLASVSKPLVTAAVMKLVEDGKISLQNKVSEFLPDFRPTLENGVAADITIHQLLTHTSGLSYRFWEKPGGVYDSLNISDGLDQPGLSLEENLSRLAKAPLKFVPGTQWNYSLSIDVLGKILETVTGKTLQSVVAEYVTIPLGMTSTDFSVKDEALLATPYANGNPQPVKMKDGQFVPLGNGGVFFAPSRILNKNSYPSGGGGMVGNAPDLLKFFESIRKGGQPILKRETVKMMMEDQVGEKAATQGPGWGFGYGWAVLDDPTKTGTAQAVGTLQWGGAYGHRWFIDPVNNITVVALTNTVFEGMDGAFPTQITEAIYGK